MKVLGVVSGGLDSVVSLWVMKEVYGCEVEGGVYFDYGQRNKDRELEMVKWNVERLGGKVWEIDVREVFCRDKSVLIGWNEGLVKGEELVNGELVRYVAGRNMVFASIVGSLAEQTECDLVVMGLNAEEGVLYADNRKEFVERMNAVYEFGLRKKVRLLAPLVNLRKSEIIVVGKEIGVDFGKTWSCDDREELACGRCACCYTRLRAFKEAGIEDSLRYRLSDSEYREIVKDVESREIKFLECILKLEKLGGDE